jgi:oligosaccharyltransferase complex subunit alpha (ribophorin I)
VHFENNSPFATMRTMEKDIEISQWGNIAIEEKYLIEHTGARLKGSFSRYDYQRTNQQASSSFRFITAVLPPTARDIYYRDQIGNISTSHVREESENAIIMQVLPRFPLFGGWKTDFYMGYNVPAWQYLSKENGISFTYVLNVTFGSPFPQVSVDEAVVRVILPEGASNIEWSTPFDIDEEGSSTVISYLDTTGRPALILKKANIVHHHNDYFQVSYRFPAIYMLREPVFLMLAFAAFFAASMAYMRVELSISERVAKSAGVSQRAGRAGELINRVVDTYPRINAIYRSRNDDAITNADKYLQDLQVSLSEIAKDPALASKAKDIEAKLIKFRVQAKKYAKAKDDKASEARTKFDAQAHELDELVAGLSSS